MQLWEWITVLHLKKHGIATTLCVIYSKDGHIAYHILRLSVSTCACSCEWLFPHRRNPELTKSQLGKMPIASLQER